MWSSLGPKLGPTEISTDNWCWALRLVFSCTSTFGSDETSIFLLFWKKPQVTRRRWWKMASALCNKIYCNTITHVGLAVWRKGRLNRLECYLRHDLKTTCEKLKDILPLIKSINCGNQPETTFRQIAYEKIYLKSCMIDSEAISLGSEM